MRLTRYEPFDVLNQMSNFFNDMVRNDHDLSKIATSQWMPAVDIREEKNCFVIEADLPGVSKEAIDISMSNNVLTIRGERQSEQKEESTNWSRVERTRGSFYRQFSLPDTADSENIKACCENGVLIVTVPKKELAQPRRIAIEEKKTNGTSLIGKVAEKFSKDKATV